MKSFFKRFVPGAGLFLLCYFFQYGISLEIFPQASMDASYYHILAGRVLDGQGLTEPFIWNYLKPYTQVTHPIDYWQPFGIFLYAAARFVGGLGGEIALNHLLWSLLAVCLFHDVRVATKNLWSGLIGFALITFSGKFALYVSTTDNVAIYAFLGYLLLRELCPPDGEQRSEGWQGTLLGFLSGLMALTRIEGLLFGALTGLILLKRRRWQAAGFLAGACLLTVSPWMIRNYQTFGVCWNSSPGALFMRNYDDLFERGRVLDWAYFIQPGWEWILQSKWHSLRQNLLNFFLVPSQFFLFPFFVSGFLLFWRRSGKLLLGFTTIFWLLNGILFTFQSQRGTAFHMTAAFFPHTAYLGAIGVDSLLNTLLKHRSVALRVGIGLLVIAYSLAFTLIVTKVSNTSYREELRPYQTLFATQPLASGASMVSIAPIQAYLLSGCPGVMMPNSISSQTSEFAEEFGCRYLLFDGRVPASETTDLTQKGWKQLYASPPLTLWEKASPKE